MDEIEHALTITRGHFIERAVCLEMSINLFLSRHFGKTPDIQDDLFYHLFMTNRITFDSKIELLDISAKQHYPKLLERKPSYFKDLKKIIEHRNNFAHLHLDITPSGKEANKKGIISLAKYNKTNFINPIEYTQESVNELINLMYDYIDEFDKLINE